MYIDPRIRENRLPAPPGAFIHNRRMTKALLTLRRKTQSETPVVQMWIPAFAGMTAMAFGATPCRVVNPAFAGMTVVALTAATSMASFLRSRE